jgi:ABC-type uncharacterized transport system involved in gliding motility auxiliary subunit
MWNWLVSKFSKLFSSSKVEQELPNVAMLKVEELPQHINDYQKLPATKTETPMPKVNTPAKSKFEKYNKPAESKYKSTVQSESNAIKVDNTDYVTPYVATAIIMSSSDSCSSSNYSSSDYSSSSSSSSSSCD